MSSNSLPLTISEIRDQSRQDQIAVDLAREFNITLVGFLRGDTFNIYSSEERIR